MTNRSHVARTPVMDARRWSTRLWRVSTTPEVVTAVAEAASYVARIEKEGLPAQEEASRQECVRASDVGLARLCQQEEG
jgi:hypothetical protein